MRMRTIRYIKKIIIYHTHHKLYIKGQEVMTFNGLKYLVISRYYKIDSPFSLIQNIFILSAVLRIQKTVFSLFDDYI